MRAGYKNGDNTFCQDRNLNFVDLVFLIIDLLVGLLEVMIKGAWY